MRTTEKIWNRRFILLFITNLLVLAAFYASIPIIPVYCQEIGITGSKVGIVLTAMSVSTVLFRPVAGYLLDNFNRYHVYLLFLALFCLSFPAFIAFPVFALLIVVRLYMGVVYSVCGSATMTLAGDVLPVSKITEGISRFAFTVSIGMAVGPFVGLQVQNNMNSKASFLTIFGITVAALICVSCCRIKYPKTQRKPFSLKESIYGPALPFMFSVLPSNDIPRFDVAHALLFEIRKDFAFDDAGLHLPGTLLEPVLEIFLVQLVESFKGHLQITCTLSEEVSFPLKRFFFCRKTTLGLAFWFAFPVRETELGVPCAILVFVSTHFIYLLAGIRF